MPMLEPEQVPEVKSAISLFEGSLTPCPPEHIKRLMTKLGAAFPAGKLTDGEVAAREAVYVELLGDIPLDILANAFKKAGQTCRFFPSAAEIREHARPELSKRKWRLFCLNRMLAKYERDYRPPLGPNEVCKPEEARAIVAEVLERVGAKPDGLDKAQRRQAAKSRASKAA